MSQTTLTQSYTHIGCNRPCRDCGLYSCYPTCPGVEGVEEPLEERDVEREPVDSLPWVEPDALPEYEPTERDLAEFAAYRGPAVRPQRRTHRSEA